jgi:hypothetical protein
MAKRKITARKYMGDDAYSWAVFVDGRPAYTGLTRREVPYYRQQLEEKYNKPKQPA